MMQFYVDIPKEKLPIFIIGAGSIINDAHLPAYEIASFRVGGIYDINIDKAKVLAQKFQIPKVFESLDQLILEVPAEAVFDVALPASEIIPVISRIPKGRALLIQKPMGNNFSEAREILQITRDRNFIAGINFQLRYAPFIMEARKIIKTGAIGELCDIEINVNIQTPWNWWDFIVKSSRIEILYHSIHYIDLVRSFFGNPQGMLAKTTRHPKMPALAAVRSSIIMDYGDWIRATILTNHCHEFGPKYQHSYIKFEGTKGAIRIKMGLLMDYPKGEADTFEYISTEGKPPYEWKTIDIDGTWFPHAFIGSMSQLMRAASGEIVIPDNSVEDCIHTMACVEAAYESSEKGGLPLIS
jgi:predicted dehydrogenase